MPVEIRELIIRAVATAPKPETDQAAATSSELTAEDYDRLVQECVRQVMEILKRERER